MIDNALWHAFTVDTDDGTITDYYSRRWGVLPKMIIREFTLVLAGPVPIEHAETDGAAPDPEIESDIAADFPAEEELCDADPHSLDCTCAMCRDPRAAEDWEVPDAE